MDLLSTLKAQAESLDKQVLAADAVSLHGDFRPHSDAVAPSADWVSPTSPAGIDLYGYQAAAVETIHKFRKAIVGFAPGMGKTPMALNAVANEIEAGHTPILVVVPPTLRRMWEAECNRFFPHLSVQVVTGTKAKDITPTDIVIVGDSVVAPRLEDLQALSPQGLVIDEAHRIKNLKAKRSQAVLTLADEIPADGIIVGLTGTLAVNRPNEIFPPIRMCGPGYAKAISGGSTITKFEQRWCDMVPVAIGRGRYVNKVVGCTDAPALHEQLREVLYIRVERDDVLDMPAKVWSHQNVVVNGARREYDRAERDFINWLIDVKGGSNDRSAQAAAARARRAEAVVKMNHLIRLAGVAKAESVVDEYVQDLVDQGEQVVVLAHNKEVASLIDDTLYKAGIKTAKLVGGMGDNAKADAEDDFKNGRVQVLVGNIQTCSEGLNLETACHLVFTQLPWSPGMLQQASDRIYRVTQQRNCTIHVLNLDESIDERMWGVLNAKAAVVDAINAGQECTIPVDSVQDEVLESYL